MLHQSERPGDSEKGAAILASQALVDALPPEERVGLVDLGDAHVKGRDVALHVWGASARG